MLLRRERTLMDRFVQPPGTTFSQGIMEQHIAYMTNLMWPEMFLDRQRWGWPCTSGTCGMYCWNTPWPTNSDFGAPGLSTKFIVPRRTHWFVTHSITNTSKPIGLGNNLNAGIPLPQPPNAYLSVLAVETSPASGNQAQEYICLTNPIPLALDISGWKLSGAIDFTFKPGTVVPANNTIYISPDVAAFRARSSGPRGGQALFVVGPYNGQLSSRGETIDITDDRGRLVATNTYAGAPSPAQQYLRITELMYHPAALPGDLAGPEEFEYIEIKNISAGVSLDLTGVRFTNGVDFTFTGAAITALGPSQTALVVKNLPAFTARYGGLPNIAGEYGGYLNNGGERMQLLDGKGEEILDFNYNNNWYPITDGLGFSLVVVDEQAQPDAWSSKANWRPSNALGGSPGTNDPAPANIPSILVNEALTRTDVPPPTDSIELYNPTGSDADIGGWFLTDDFMTPKKFRIPEGTRIGAGGFLVFDESQFNPAPGVPPSFALSSGGDEVYLFSGDGSTNLTGYVHGYAFGAADDGVSFGRYLTSVGEEHFVAQMALSLGTPNAGPRVGPLVISEIMYHPPDIGTNDSTADEFIELLNVSSNSVFLFDPVAPANAWKISGGVDLPFPTNRIVAPGETLLLVNFDPATNVAALANFRSKYGVANSVQTFGPYGGKLNNGGDKIEIKKPVLLQVTNVSYVLVDKVSYSDTAPWPGGTDGFGLSLQRKSPAEYGDDPTNWTAALPTAGASFQLAGNPPVLTQDPTNLAVLQSGTATFSVSANGTAPLSYQWRFAGRNLDGATNATLQVANAQSENFGDYQVVVFNSAGSAVSAAATLDILYPLTILGQPQSQKVRLAGMTNAIATNLTFSVQALSSSPITYQWRFNGADIPGATNSTYTLTNASLASQGSYQARVTDPLGSLPSDPATLGILVAPSLTQPLPAAPTAVLQGANVSYTVAISANPPPYNFQWRRGSLILTNMSLATTNCTFTLSNVQPSNSGLYRVVITNLASISNAPVLFSTNTLTVLADTDGDGIPDFWESLYGLDPNNKADASLDSDGDGLTNLQEYIAGTDPTNALSYLKIDHLDNALGATTLQFGAVSNKSYSLLYKESPNIGLWTRFADLAARPSNWVATVQDPYPVTSDRLYRLATPQLPGPINTGPAILTSPQPVRAGVGDDVSFSVFAAGTGPLSYQWLFQGNNLGGQTRSNLLRNGVQFGDAGQYAVMVSDQIGSQTTDAADLALRPLITIQPQSQSVVAGGDASFTVQATGTGPLLYRWRHNNAALAGQTNATLNLTNVQSADAGAYTVTIRVQTPLGMLGTTSSNAVLDVVSGH